MSKLIKKKVAFRVEGTIYLYDGQPTAGDLAANRMIQQLKGTSATVEETTTGSGMQAMIIINEAKRVKR